MIKNKLLKIMLATSSCFACLPITTTMVSCVDNKLPEIKKHTTKICLFNDINANIDGYIVSTKKPYNVHFFNGSSIGYIDVDEYVRREMKVSQQTLTGNDYVSVTKNYKTIITNTLNNATCTIDYRKQQLIYSDIDAFLDIDFQMIKDNPLAAGIGGGEALLQDTVSEYAAPTQAYVIDLTKYSLMAYYEDGKGYLPYEMFRNFIFNSSAGSTYMFNGYNFYQIVNSTSALELYDLPKKTSTIFNKEYMEYRYNLLAATLDHRFGLNERQSRSNPGTTISYFKDGAYKALKPYHDGMVSLDPDVSNLYTRLFMNNCCDDGGHARWRNYDLLSEREISSGYGSEYSLTLAAKDKMGKARDVYWKNTDGWKWDDPWEEKRKAGEWNMEPTQKIEMLNLDGQTGNETLWVTFDSFKYTGFEFNNINSLDEWRKIYEKIGDGKGDTLPYQYDTISLTMQLQKIISNDTSHNIKNLFIDISHNGGGTVCTEHILASYLCGNNNKCLPQKTGRQSGGVTRALYNPHTGAFGRYTMYADINCDGKYNELDQIPDYINIYMITSPSSFSCGNMLPGDLKYCNKNVKFIGDRTGGGACYVDGDMHLGLGSIFRSSSNFHSLTSDSTIDKKESNDNGVTPDNKYHFDWNTESDKFFDRQSIWNLVHQE